MEILSCDYRRCFVLAENFCSNVKIVMCLSWGGGGNFHNCMQHFDHPVNRSWPEDGPVNVA